MTITVTPRRAALVVLAVIALAVVYIIGASRSGGAPAASSTFTQIANTSSTLRPSTLRPSTQPTAIPAIGGPGITVAGSANAKLRDIGRAGDVILVKELQPHDATDNAREEHHLER